MNGKVAKFGKFNFKFFASQTRNKQNEKDNRKKGTTKQPNINKTSLFAMTINNKTFKRKGEKQTQLDKLTCIHQIKKTI